jgi:hypothetical protein
VINRDDVPAPAADFTRRAVFAPGPPESLASSASAASSDDEMELMEEELEDPPQNPPEHPFFARSSRKRRASRRVTVTGDAVDPELSGPTKRRRRVSLSMGDMFAFIEGKVATCKLGCVDSKKGTLKPYTISSKGTVKRHCESLHPEYSQAFEKLHRGELTLFELERRVSTKLAETIDFIRKQYSSKLQFRPQASVDNATRSSLLLTAWASANGISRLVFSCPIFDSFLKSLGSAFTTNRKSMQSDFLPKLDTLVSSSIRNTLENIPAVSIICDGWKDCMKRSFLSVSVSFMDTVDARWVIRTVDLDLIPVHGSSTGDAIEHLIQKSLLEYV